MSELRKMQSEPLLHPYSIAHDAQTVAWLNSPDMQSTFGLRRSVTVVSHRAWVDSATDTHIYAILGPQSRHVGNVLLKVSERHLSAYFQIYIGDSGERGRGIGAWALAEALRLAFGLHRIWLHTFADNLRAEALYAKFGFKREGLERDALRVEDSFLSQTRWSLLRPEWLATSERGL
jgi:RimJ/RimL family protein N-acetyltransferase